MDNKKKISDMKKLSRYRRHYLSMYPQLRHLFIEMTCLCNERCLHCGSRCGEIAPDNMLSGDEICRFLDYVKTNFDISKMMLNITGGEPLLRPDFFEIMQYANRLGFHWGMTTNATLIDDEVAEKLQKAGMKTVSVSIDGLPETHDWFRQTKNAYEKAMNGVRALVKNGGFNHVQVTTVVHKKNINELDALYEILTNENIRSWRVINLEPIGRAKELEPLDKDDYIRMFNFIKEKRFAGKMEVVYGCSHYLGVDLERELRPWYFICNAGIYTASVMFNGDIGACLDIERRPELIQGNIRTDDFKSVWENKFKIFRDNSHACKGCKHAKYCGGDSFHTWNFDENRPNLCFKGILFE